MKHYYTNTKKYPEWAIMAWKIMSGKIEASEKLKGKISKINSDVSKKSGYIYDRKILIELLKQMEGDRIRIKIDNTIDEYNVAPIIIDELIMVKFHEYAIKSRYYLANCNGQVMNFNKSERYFNK